MEWRYSDQGDYTRIACSYKELPNTVGPGDQILIADGSLVTKVREWYEDSVWVEVMNNATIGEKKNMNLPGIKVNLPTLTEQDEKDILEFGLKRGIDIIAASFIRRGSDIKDIRELLGIKGSYFKIIAKIENQEGLENFDDILDKADGIMVAREDLGMELPTEMVFLAQKISIKNMKTIKPVRSLFSLVFDCVFIDLDRSLIKENDCQFSLWILSNKLSKLWIIYILIDDVNLEIIKNLAYA